MLKAVDPAEPATFEARLRRLFPRVLVRERGLASEPPAWYVYRDGGWQPSLTGDWWTVPGLPQLSVSLDGWLVEANATAVGLLELDPAESRTRHFTDFIVPGTLGDAQALFDILNDGHALTATVLIRPTSGHVIACDLHARRHGDVHVSVLRLADDVEFAPPIPVAPKVQVTTLPESDLAFRGYLAAALSRMPEPTPDGLAIRLRRLYPHAEVQADGDGWVALRERATGDEQRAAWWMDGDLPRVRYDAQGLIVEASPAAETMLGRTMAGHHWQEFVTPGSTEQVSAMLAILAEVGRADSRFRMPRADGTLIEFDSYTEVHGEDFVTVMRERHPDTGTDARETPPH